MRYDVRGCERSCAHLLVSVSPGGLCAPGRTPPCAFRPPCPGLPQRARLGRAAFTNQQNRPRAKG
eukprot:10489587-Alexandrium_andersonii.AAC.1